MRSPRTFTDTYLRSLKPRAASYDVTDPGRRGLQVRVFPTGQKSFQLRYRLDGVTRRMTIGPYPAWSLAEAHFAHTEATKLLAKQIDPAAAKLSARDHPSHGGTVAALAEEFMQRYVLRERKRPEQVQQILDANVLPFWRQRQAKDITPRDVTLLLDKVVDRGKLTMANRVASVVAQMFKFGVQRGLLAASPCVALQRPGGKERPRERVLTEDELKTVWPLIDTAAMTPELRVATRLLLLTAQRRGELAHARWEDIDLDNAEWVIPAANAKNGKRHVVPLAPAAVTLFESLKARTGYSPWVLPSPRDESVPIIERSLSRAIRNNEAHFEVPHFTPHDLRRTAATMLSRLGTPRLVVTKVLNHTDDTITAVYDQHDYVDEKRLALHSWAEHLLDVVGGKSTAVVPISCSLRLRAR